MAELIPTPPVVLSTTPDTVNNPKTAGPETVVRLQALDGTWETCGVDRAKGIFPENVSLTSDSWGPKTATFDLKRDGTAIWPDVLAFTPVKIEVNGQLVWSGRVADTPSRDGTDTVMSIQCEGWQHHLDDDMYEKKYVKASMADWKDYRTFLDSEISTKFPEALAPSSDGQATRLAMPVSATTISDARSAVMLDMGPGNLAKRITVVYDAANPATHASMNFRVYSADSQHFTNAPFVSAASVALPVAPTTNITGTYDINSGNGHRYVMIAAAYNAGGALAVTQEVYVRLRSITVYGETSYEASNASTLKASTVVSDAVVRGCPLLTTDTSLISTTAEALPEYAPDGPKTPREHINAVNGFHGWASKVDAFRRVNFYAKPSRPKYELGEFSQMETSDSAGSSGAEIYNKVIVTGQDPAGQPVSVVRQAAMVSSTVYQTAQTDIVCANPSFATDAAGWTANGGSTITRTTTGGEFDSSAGGGKLTTGPGYGAAYITLSGTARLGQAYIITLVARDTGYGSEIILSAGASAVIPLGSERGFPLTASFATYSYVWLPSSTIVSPVLSVMNNYNNLATPMFFDSIQIKKAAATLPDRRGFHRTFNLQVNSVLPTDGVLAAAIGDAWLANHATTTFKGDVTLTGPKALRDRVSGQPIPLYDLLANTDEVAYFGDRGSPDTGSVGRAARITSVTYTPADDKAVVTLDNTRTNFDNLLNRLGATS